MKRLSAGLAIAALAVTAGPALAAPGSFPEQPGTHNATGCAAVGQSGAPTAPRSERAAEIVTSLFIDACTPAP